jgi:hypothetical protein
MGVLGGGAFSRRIRAFLASRQETGRQGCAANKRPAIYIHSAALSCVFLGKSYPVPGPGKGATLRRVN